MNNPELHNSEERDPRQPGSETLSRELMEEMLTDFAFERLADDEALRFEAALEAHPDLKNDVKQIRESFAMFDKADYLERRRRSSRNVSVHVQDELSARQRAAMRNKRFYMRMAPFALASIIAIFIYPPFDYPDSDDGTQTIELAEEQPNQTGLLDGGLPNLAGMDDFLLLGADEEISALMDEYPEASLMVADVTLDDLDAESAELLLETSWHVNAGMPVLDLLPEDLLEAELQTLFEGVEHVASL